MEFIRVTNQEQLKECLDIRKEVFVIEQQVPVDLEIDEIDASPASGYHVLIREDNQGVAAARWKDYGEGRAKLQRIAVRKLFRGTGLGSKLVSGMELHAKELGFREAVLDAQCQAESFYAKMGYKTISEEPFDDAGIPHVRMIKSL
ncbi:GNAT family N-acetyltransferase [Paenibacillus sp. FJAT-26967]|uniref:GNAT family N-acetyltransferase n=1 Tax=Paenibacillus sp. FJAT-26967 TaxID=1729690 RepID=UPI00083979AF|nr:GNAT family N-acetyltransferase [Paenibacillus sp. FJAT-26967]